MNARSLLPTTRRRLVLIGAGGVAAVGLAAFLAIAQDNGKQDPDGADAAALVNEPAIPPDLVPVVASEPLPALHEAPTNTERRDLFIAYLAPIVAKVNENVRKRRAAVLAVERRLDQADELDPEVAAWVEAMVERYRVDATTTAEQIDALKHRIDIVPVSLAVAQAGIESAWGTSRFARQGNNLFGKWCFSPGCGIVPARRPPTATYEVEAYDDVAGSVRSYIHHLNSHPIYEIMRERRATARAEQRPPTGTDLAAGLEFYSAKGNEYVEIIRHVIHTNDLETLAQSDLAQAD